jgi:ATP-dependent helicase HrpA
MNHKTIAPSPTHIARAMRADRFALRKAWQRLHARRASPAAEAVAQWQARLEASIAVREARQANLPALHFDPELPITGHREQIVELIKTRQTIVVCGETGSGKSTQLPKLCLEAGLGVGAVIGHTQPRRLAARAVASRLAEELGSRVGERVGFKIRFTDTTQAGTLVKLMTDGVLLAETQSDRFLDQYDALIIDEAHERSLNIDFLLGYLRQLSGRRPDLKLIITSATIDPQRFAQHFADEQGPAPIVEVSGRTYPVDIRYRPLLTEQINSSEAEQWAAIAAATDELMAAGSGDILVFLPTERDIREAHKHLRGHYTQAGQRVEILPLYARLSQAEQNKIFAPHPARRIVLSTNVAESSLTVPGIRYVVDTGLVRISRYAPRSKVQRLPIEAVSQASANQRAGRCGRLGPGICIRLYEAEEFSTRSLYTTPEIRRSDLASVLLQSKVLRLGSLAEFPLLDPPSPEALRDAERTLTELGAIDAHHELTAIGRQLGQLPCEPRVGRMLIEAHQRKCLAEVVIMAAGLETQDVRQRPAGQRPQADEAHAEFADPHSDFLSYLRLWDFYDRLKSELGRGRLQKALSQKFLSYQGFREWSEVVRQLKELLTSAGITCGPRKYYLPSLDPASLEAAHPRRHQKGSKSENQRNAQATEKLKRPDGYAAIHQSLLTGLLSGVAQRGDTYEYKAAGGLSIALWPGSGLFSRQPHWIMAAEIVETTKRYGRTIAEIDVQWIEPAAGELLKNSYSDPHWSSKTGAAMVYRRATLYGLPIVVGQRVALAPIDRDAARDMLIEQGLVEGNWNCREAFYLHNQELLADMHELVQRTRSRDYILDRYHVAAFYNSRLPQEIYDLATLRAWLSKHQRDKQQGVQHQGDSAERGLWMQPEDLLEASSPPTQLEASFPNILQVGATELPLAYHFEPGHAEDGVTLTIPQAALRQISDEALGWLVPGLLEEKILFLIRALPKALRTNFVPAPDAAKLLAQQLAQTPRDASFTSALCAVMSAHAGERIEPQQFDTDKLPAHLHFLVRVVNDAGEVIDSGRNVAELQAKLAPPLAALGSSSAAVEQSGQDSQWSDRAVTPQDFDHLPTQVTVRRGGLLVAAFPALVVVKDKVEMRLAETADDAERLTRRGLTRLFSIQNQRLLRSQIGHLPQYSSCSVKLAHLLPSQELASALQDLLVRMALVEGQPLLHSREEFEARQARASGQISVATQELAAWLPKLAEQVHQVRLLLEQPPAPWRTVFEQLREQTMHLTKPDFLSETPWIWLAEYPRYFQAMRCRIDRLKNGGVPKDQALAQPIVVAWRSYLELVERRAPQTPVWTNGLQELRWMVEELRVSIFAQQLGTKVSVSPKRVQGAIDGLRQMG